MTNTEKTVTWGLGVFIAYWVYQCCQRPAISSGQTGYVCPPSGMDENHVSWVEQLGQTLQGDR
jgi:hypothetical protein